MREGREDGIPSLRFHTPQPDLSIVEGDFIYSGSQKLCVEERETDGLTGGDGLSCDGGGSGGAGLVVHVDEGSGVGVFGGHG